MKLLIAIVNNEDSAVVSSALTKEGFSVTKLYDHSSAEGMT